MWQAHYWEYHLLDMAHEALKSEAGAHVLPQADRRLLAAAYQHCADITRQNSKTFFLASNLLPIEKRRAVQALYAFCRVSDDLVDRPAVSAQSGLAVQTPVSTLETWRRQIVHGEVGSADNSAADPLVIMAWADARRNYCIPRGYVEQLIDGLALDFQSVRYETFSSLARYCYGVACTVGLMSMHITGYSGRDAIPYAIRLGVALQLTNILRDVGEDWRAGRLYLPEEELRAFQLSEADIMVGVDEGIYDHRWREFMHCQIATIRRLYEDALPGVAHLHPDGRFAIAAAGELYRSILDQIEANDYDVFSRRASVGAWGKLRRLPGIWLRTKALK